MILKDNLWLNRYEWASKTIKAIADQNTGINMTLFDVGSRDNILKGYLQTVPIQYRGFDLEPLDPTTEKWDIEEPFPYSYPSPQAIAFLEVLEHLNNPGLSLKNIGNLLKPGGILILTTPNPQWSTSRLSLFSTGSLTCFTQADLDLNHHVFTPWLHVVEKLLTDAGFEIDEYVTLDGKTKVFDKTLRGGNIFKKLFARMVKKIIESRDPASCGMSYGIVAKKIA